MLISDVSSDVCSSDLGWRDRSARRGDRSLVSLSFSGSCSFSFWGAEPPLLTDKTALSGGESARFAACRGGRAAYICREPMVMNSHRRGSAGRCCLTRLPKGSADRSEEQK